MSPERREAIVASLQERGIASEMAVYRGCTHGFASRPALHVEHVKVAFEKALDQQVEWLARWIVRD